MKSARKYTSAGAFRKALEDRLLAIAGTEKVDISRLRRQVAFDRLLARLFRDESIPWGSTGIRSSITSSPVSVRFDPFRARRRRSRQRKIQDRDSLTGPGTAADCNDFVAFRDIHFLDRDFHA